MARVLQFIYGFRAGNPPCRALTYTASAALFLISSVTEACAVMKSAKAFLVWRNTHSKRTLVKVPYALMDVAMSELLIDVPAFRS
jgi:hypothetical protein